MMQEKVFRQLKFLNQAFIGLVRIMLLFKFGGYIFSGMIINYSDIFSGAHETL